MCLLVLGFTIEGSSDVWLSCPVVIDPARIGGTYLFAWVLEAMGYFCLIGFVGWRLIY